MSDWDGKADAWMRFAEAVRAARNGDYRLAQQLVESVRARFGNAVAEVQRRELWACIERGEDI